MSELEMSVLRVLSVNTIFTEKHATAHRNERQNTALVLKWEGETVYTDASGACILSNATHPVLLPRTSRYRWECTRAGRCTIVEFDTDFASEKIIGWEISDSERLLQSTRNLELECLHKKPYWHYRACATVNKMLYEILTAASGAYVPSDKLGKIKPAVDYMAAHYNEELSNEFLAGLTEVSTVYFRKLFTAAYGMPPMQYLAHMRIEKAREMLKSDYGTLSGVAASVGYPNVFHFSKAFKQQTGISPGAYAKRK